MTRLYGTARLDKRTKDLVKRLGAGDIAIIDHVDLDRVSAEGLLASGVEVVVNAAPSISGAYPNGGPLLLARAGVRILDRVGSEVFELLHEGETVEIVGAKLVRDARVLATGQWLTIQSIEESMERANGRLGERLDEFARNTLDFLERERDLLADGGGVPRVRTAIDGRHVLVVVRGHDYREDLRALAPYIREMKPVLIGVDGGADAIREEGFTPDIIVGDMDSVSDEALRSGAELIAHVYEDGRSPAMERIRELGLEAIPWSIRATS
ncbi:MAG TPA: putative cytokinetic ring protein SteA, partial [Coriobacteriia bacterium]|nr:putative cytokinetic ring protein SteA [Coriobacteriia bacterium]